MLILFFYENKEKIEIMKTINYYKTLIEFAAKTVLINY